VYAIRLVKIGATFDAAADEVILDAAERAGIVLTHSCRSGTCRACITRVLSGCIEHDPEYADELSIDAGEIEAGYRLLCSALARSDAELER
jgi:CDP-4-dehydro-6-deoxyglucose reductase